MKESAFHQIPPPILIIRYNKSNSKFMLLHFQMVAPSCSTFRDVMSKSRYSFAELFSINYFSKQDEHDVSMLPNRSVVHIPLCVYKPGVVRLLLLFVQGWSTTHRDPGRTALFHVTLFATYVSYCDFT